MCTAGEAVQRTHRECCMPVGMRRCAGSCGRGLRELTPRRFPRCRCRSGRAPPGARPRRNDFDRQCFAHHQHQEPDGERTRSVAESPPDPGPPARGSCRPRRKARSRRGDQGPKARERTRRGNPRMRASCDPPRKCEIPRCSARVRCATRCAALRPGEKTARAWRVAKRPVFRSQRKGDATVDCRPP